MQSILNDTVCLATLALSHKDNGTVRLSAPVEGTQNKGVKTASPGLLIITKPEQTMVTNCGNHKIRQRSFYSSLRNLAYFLPLSSMIDQVTTSPGFSCKPLTMSSGTVSFNDAVLRLARFTLDVLLNGLFCLLYLLSLFSSKNLLMAKSCLFGRFKRNNHKYLHKLINHT